MKKKNIKTFRKIYSLTLLTSWTSVLVFHRSLLQIFLSENIIYIIAFNLLFK